MKRQTGFSLIEMLLVLAIIGILSGVIIPQIIGQQESARQKATEAAVGAIRAECQNVASQFRDAGIPVVAAEVIATILEMPEYQAPRAKNAYITSESPYGTAGTPKYGAVHLYPSQLISPINGNRYQAIVIYYRHGGSASTISNVTVPLDY